MWFTQGKSATNLVLQTTVSSRYGGFLSGLFGDIHPCLPCRFCSASSQQASPVLRLKKCRSLLQETARIESRRIRGASIIQHARVFCCVLRIHVHNVLCTRFLGHTQKREAYLGATVGFVTGQSIAVTSVSPDT